MSDDRSIGEILGEALGHRDPPLIRAGLSIGDLDALRELAEQAYQSTLLPHGIPALGYVEAITLQRLIAVGGDLADKRTLVFLLSQFAAHWRTLGNTPLETAFEAQALQLAEALATDGDDEMADMIVAAADAIPAAVHAEVARLRDGEAAGCTER